ncbi:MAG: hypothetical protein ABIG89_02525 [Candidatus Woesearchaeota archaeon]
MTKTNINRQIWNIISRDIALQKCLKDEIINNRALAKFLIKKHNLTYSLDAVLSAVRRYVGEEFEEHAEEIEEAFSKIIILTKNNIASIKLKSDSFTNIANDHLTKQALKFNFRMAKTKEIIKLIVNQKDIEKKLHTFDQQYILDVTMNLCEIRIMLDKDATYVRGFISRISNELALHDVNIHDIIIAVPEILIYVDEKELINAQKCLMELKNS